MTRPLAEPTFDNGGYPTEATLRRIRRWKITASADFEAVMDFAGRAWGYPQYWTKDPAFVEPGFATGIIRPRIRYVFSTSGWSGNESIVSAIEGNKMVQVIGAYSWRRGGHFEYRFPIAAPEEEK